MFREGAETVLFLHALAGSNGGWNGGLIVGLIGAAVCLSGIFAAMQWVALRLPLRTFFLSTSAFLFIMGLHLIGGAMQEFQEQLLIPYDMISAPEWIISFGINATWEAIGAQLIVAVVATVSTFAARLHRESV